MTKNRSSAVLVFIAIAGALVGGAVAWGFFWNQGTHSLASAGELLQDACEQTQAQTEFDIRTEITTPTADRATGTFPMRTWILDTRVSGDDFHIVVNLEDEPRGEILGVDGITYEKMPGGDWFRQDRIRLGYVHGLVSSRMAGQSMSGTHDILCPEGAVARVGEEELDSGDAVRYQILETFGTPGPVGNVLGDSTPDSEVPMDPGYNAAWDFWVGDDGLLAQTNQRFTTMSYPELGGDAVAWSIQYRTVISGVGEPNVIEAPLILVDASTPTPTPTPTPPRIDDSTPVSPPPVPGGEEESTPVPVP